MTPPWDDRGARAPERERPIPTLLHLNGPPAVGKSTIASRLVQTRRLALNVDIDELRVRLGGWAENPESKRVARSLGFGLALQHLQAGHDVVLPQLLLLDDVVEDVGRIATRAGAEFIEVLLLASHAELMTRVRESHIPGAHPRDEFTVEELDPRVGASTELLNQLVAARPSARLVDVSGLAPDQAADLVRKVVGWG